MASYHTSYRRFGYAIVNFINHEIAEGFMKDSDGFTDEGFCVLGHSGFGCTRNERKFSHASARHSTLKGKVRFNPGVSRIEDNLKHISFYEDALATHAEGFWRDQDRCRLAHFQVCRLAHFQFVK